MHTLLDMAGGVVTGLESWASALSNLLAGIAGRPLTQGDFVLAAIIVASFAISLGGCIWALLERLKAAASRQLMRVSLARAQSEIRFREAMISACPEAIAILGADLSTPMSYRGGGAMLQACLSGPNAAMLAAKLEGLLETGAGFSLSVATAARETVQVRGCPVGSRAAVFLRSEPRPVEGAPDFRAALDALPIPVWIRGKDLALRWVNSAFMSASASQQSEQAVLSANLAFDRSELDLARAAEESHETVSAKRYVTLDGKRRAYAMTLRRLSAGGVAGTALDVTEAAQAEAALKLRASSYAQLLDRLPSAVAIFGADRHLDIFNQSFVRMSELPDEWLATHPTQGEVFDRLREMRRLPERADFQSWKEAQHKLFESGTFEELWHLPGGTSLRVSAQRDAFGGLTYVFEDVSAQFEMESTFKATLGLHQSALDKLDDAVAAFGPDGRLKMRNEAFGRLWKLSEQDLEGEPLLQRIAELCSARVGRDATWDIAASAILSEEPEKYNEWATVTRMDGIVLSLSMSRLPDGVTLLVFTDVSDLTRFEAAQREDARGVA